MSNASSEPKQATQAPSPAHDGWLTRAQVAAELGYRSIFPIRKMEGTKLHPVREARGWVFDPAEVAEVKLTRIAPSPAAPAMSEGKIAARVFYLFDHGRELCEVVQEAEVPPSIVRELWHEWLTDLDEGEMERRKTAQEDRRSRTPKVISRASFAPRPARLPKLAAPFASKPAPLRHPWRFVGRAMVPMSVTS